MVGSSLRVGESGVRGVGLVECVEAYALEFTVKALGLTVYDLQKFGCATLALKSAKLRTPEL